MYDSDVRFHCDKKAQCNKHNMTLSDFKHPFLSLHLLKLKSNCIFYCITVRYIYISLFIIYTLFMLPYRKTIVSDLTMRIVCLFNLRAPEQFLVQTR